MNDFDKNFQRGEIKEVKIKKKKVKEVKPKKEKKHLFFRSLNKNDGPFRNFISILIGYIDTILLYNIFFIITALGIVTIGPALVSMVDCYNDFVANKTEHRYRKFFQYLKRNFNVENVILGIVLTGILAGLCYLFIFFLINTPENQWMIVPWILAHILMIYSVCFFSFYSLMKVRINLPTKIIITNALKLALGSIKSILFVLLSFGIIFFVPLVFFEYTFPLFILISFSTTTLACMMSCYSEVDKHVIYMPNDLEVKEEKKGDIKFDLIDDFIKEDEKISNK